MTQASIDWDRLSYRPGEPIRATIRVSDSGHRPLRSLQWFVYYNASPVSSGTGTEVIVQNTNYGVYKLEVNLVDFDGDPKTLRSAVAVSGGSEAMATLPPPSFTGSMVHLGTLYSVELVGPAGVPQGAPAQLAGLTQVVYLLPGTTHVSFALDPDQALVDGDVVVRTKSGNWALLGGSGLQTEDLGFGYRVDAGEPVPAPKDLKLQLTTEVYHVSGSTHGAFSARVRVSCWRLGPQLYHYEACDYTLLRETGSGLRLAAFFKELEVVQPDGTVVAYRIPDAYTIPGIRMASSGLPSLADRATGLGFTESNRGVIYEAAGLADMDAFSVAGIPGIRPGILSVEQGGLSPVVPRIRRLQGTLLLYANGPIFAGTKVTVLVETGNGTVPVVVSVGSSVQALEKDTFALAGTAAVDLADFQFGQTGLVTHFILDTSLAVPSELIALTEPSLGADHVYAKVRVSALNLGGVCYVNPDPRRLVEDLEILADPVKEVPGCQDSSCGPQGLYCYSNSDGQPTVTVTATDPTATEAGDTGQFTFTRDGLLDVPLTVFFTVGGSATAGVDYQAIGSFVTFGVGTSNVTKSVLVLTDTLTESVETVTVFLTQNPAYILGQPSVATVSIIDNTPVVVVTASGTAATESGVTANFSFQRTGSTTSALTVNFTVGGSATAAADYISLGTSVTFASGQAIALKTVTPVPDLLVEGTESVVLSLVPGPSYAVGNPHVATVYITDTTPEVTVAATSPNATESGTTGTFTFSRTGPTTAALTVDFTMGGTAVDGVDFGTLGGSVTFAIGQATATKVLVPVQDILVEGSEYATLTLSAGAAYAVGKPSTATVYILDDDAPAPPQPVVTVVATDDTASEAGGNNGLFTFTRTGSLEAALSANFTVGGTATSGTDYTAIGTSVTFAAGQAAAIKIVGALPDTKVENFETVVVTVSPGSGYVVGAPNVATVYIEDVLPVITVTAQDATATEGVDPGAFIFNRTGSTANPLTAYFTVSGSATSGVDYTENLGTQVVFDAGVSTVTKTVTPVADALAEGTETVIVTLEAGFGYTRGVPSAATVEILEPPADLVYIKVYASGSVANEAGNPNPGNFVFQVVDIDGFDIIDHPIALTVNFDVDGAAINGVDYSTQQAPNLIPLGPPVVIPAGTGLPGQGAVSVNVWAVPDLIKETENEAVVVTVKPGNGYLPYAPKLSATIYIVDDSPETRVSVIRRVTLEGGIDVDGSADEGTYNNAGEYALVSWRAALPNPPDHPNGQPERVEFYIDGSAGDQDPFVNGDPVYKDMLKDALNRASGKGQGDPEWQIIAYENGHPVAQSKGGQDPAIAATWPANDPDSGFSAPTWVYSDSRVAGWSHKAWPSWGGEIVPNPTTGWFAVVYPFKKSENAHIIPGRWDLGTHSVTGDVTLPGDPGTLYTVSMSVVGVAQQAEYTGGIQLSGYARRGGAPVNARDDYVKLTITGNTPEVYYLNSGGSRSAGNIPLSYGLDLPVQVKGGLVFTLEINNQDGFQYRAGVYNGTPVSSANVWVEIALTVTLL